MAGSEAEAHDVVVHVVAVANRKVALTGNLHPHPFVEAQGTVVAVDVQFQGAGGRV